MKHYLFTAAEKAATGYTDLFVIPYTDLTAAAIADNTAKEITLTALAVGDVVKQDVLVQISTVWAGPSDLTGTVSVGVTSDTTAMTPTLTLITAGTGTAVNTTNCSANQTDTHYCAAAAINLLAEFLPDADSGVDEYTAGEVRIFANISRAADRKSIQG